MATNWRNLISGVAPAIAGAFGGPGAALAVRTLATAVLGKPDATEDEVATALAGPLTPDDLLKLKAADQAFALAQEQIELQRQQMDAADRANARAREVALHDEWTPRVLAALVIGAFLYVVWAVMAAHATQLKEPVTIGLIGTLIGYVSAKADTVVGYYFGSSSGSAAKDKTIASAVDTSKR